MARADRVQTKDGRPINPRTMTVEDAIDAGLVFAGTPDDVFDQLKAFYDHVGGFGHLLMMGQGGLISHEDTVANLTMFSRRCCRGWRNWGDVAYRPGASVRKVTRCRKFN